MMGKSARASSKRRLQTVAIVGVIVATALAGCAGPGGGTVHDTPTSKGVVASAGQQPTISRTLNGRAYSLAYDPFREAIWYVIMTPTAPPIMPRSPAGSGTTSGAASGSADAQLFEASATTGQVITEFTIPNPDADTGLDDIVGIASDQSVWVGESYSLYRVNPSTSLVQSVTLPQAISGSVATSNQGTFVTAMTFTDKSVVIGRNNVPFLQQWSLSLDPLANLPLPGGAYGPSFLTTTSSDIQMLANSTSTTVSGTGDQMSIPLPAGESAPTSNGEQIEPQYLVVRPDRVTANLQGLDGSNILTVAGSAPQALTWQPTSGQAVQIAWQGVSAAITNPQGKQVQSQSWPQLEASVVLPNNTLWIIASSPTQEAATPSPIATEPTLQLYTAN